MKSTTYIKLIAVVISSVLLLWIGLRGEKDRKVASSLGIGEHGPKPELLEKAKALRLPGSNRLARQKAENEVYAGHPLTFFCDCRFDESGAVDAASCGFEPGAGSARAPRAVWKNVVPPMLYGGHRQCWQQGHPDCVKPDGQTYSGRWCCNRQGVDAEFRRMDLDLQNLVPVIEELHDARADRPFGEVDGEPRQYGACHFEVGEKAVEPAESKRGDIARIYLYLAGVHGLRLEPEEHEMFEKWHREDPPDEWEKERNRRIEKIQKVGNPYLKPGR